MKSIIAICFISVLFIQADTVKKEGLDEKWKLSDTHL